jgi:hypothetical protein
MSGENNIGRHVLVDAFNDHDIRAVNDLYGPSLA